MLTDDLTLIATLKGILQSTELLLGTDGVVYAQFVRDDRQVAYPLTSPDFMTWFRGEAAVQSAALPTAKIMGQAIKEIEYEVRSKGLPCPIAARIFAEDNAVVVNLGNGKALEIEASGATQVTDAGVIFPTGTNIHTLPEPESANAMEVLPAFLDLSDAQCQLAVIWLMSLFQADGRCPILIISGPRQSGKTRVARNIRQLLDPHALPLRPLPKGRDELKEAVLDNAILAFDKVGKIPNGIVTDLLALAEGTALSLPGRSQAVLCKRPTILVCEELPDAPDLLENAIVLRLKERPVTKIKNKVTLDRMFNQHHAKAFGSLVKLCSQALRHRKVVELEAMLKDAELERWLLAVDKSLNFEGKLMMAFARNVEQALSSIINERPAVRAFQALVKAQGSVTATATQLLDQIEPFLDGPKDVRYPTTGKALAKLLRDHKRYMTDIEIEFDVLTGKNRDRNIVATWQSHRVCRDTAIPSPSLAKATTKPRASAKVAEEPVKKTTQSHDQPMLL